MNKSELTQRAWLVLMVVIVLGAIWTGIVLIADVIALTAAPVYAYLLTLTVVANFPWLLSRPAFLLVSVVGTILLTYVVAGMLLDLACRFSTLAEGNLAVCRGNQVFIPSLLLAIVITVVSALVILVIEARWVR